MVINSITISEKGIAAARDETPFSLSLRLAGHDTSPSLYFVVLIFTITLSLCQSNYYPLFISTFFYFMFLRLYKLSTKFFESSTRV